MALNIRIHTNTINEHIDNEKVEKRFDFKGEIDRIIILDNKAIFLISFDKDIKEALRNYDNVFCFDFNGKLLWKSGKYEFDNGYMEKRFISPHFMMMDDDNLLLVYYFSEIYRWLDTETGVLIKEEFRSGR